MRKQRKPRRAVRLDTDAGFLVHKARSAAYPAQTWLRYLFNRTTIFNI